MSLTEDRAIIEERNKMSRYMQDKNRALSDMQEVALTLKKSYQDCMHIRDDTRPPNPT